MMPKHIVLLGPPGAGKGTQAKMIAGELGYPHVSSGDIFREHLKEETELGKLAKSFISRGELVPDEATNAMVRERLSRKDCTRGALLDGFPRTPAQAEALAEMMKDFGGQVACVPFISVPDEVLVERLTGRWTCPVCGRMYHEKFNQPKVSCLCDDDSAALYQRDDDMPETVLRRIRVYAEQTSPLLDYYRNSGLLIEVDGTQSIQVVKAGLLQAINNSSKGLK
jgi:adenylate kinase